MIPDMIWQGKVFSDPEKYMGALDIIQQWSHLFWKAAAYAKWLVVVVFADADS